MVWMAMSSRGVSEPYIVKSGNAVTAEVYIRECLSRLQDFIDQYHSDDNYIFWTDLASAHYANITQEIYESVGIKFLRKEVNPPNVAQLRPIERFWAYLGKKLNEGSFSTDNIKTLVRRIRKIIRNRPENLCQNLMKRVKTKVRTAADRGVLSVIN